MQRLRGAAEKSKRLCVSVYKLRQTTCRFLRRIFESQLRVTAISLPENNSRYMHSSSEAPAARFASACVLSASAAEQLDSSQLAAVGFRVRTSPTCMADVLIASSSLAIILLDGSELMAPTQAETHWNR